MPGASGEDWRRPADRGDFRARHEATRPVASRRTIVYAGEKSRPKHGKMTMGRRSHMPKAKNDPWLLPNPGICCRKAFDPPSGIGRNGTLMGLLLLLLGCAAQQAPTSEELYDADIKKCDALAPPFDQTRASEPDYLSQMNEAFTLQQKCYFQANVNLERRDQDPAPNLKTLEGMGAGLEPTGQRMMPAIAPPPQDSPPPAMSTP